MVAEVKTTTIVTVTDTAGAFPTIRVSIDTHGDIYIAKEGAAGAIYMTRATAKAVASALQGLASGQS